MRETAWFVAGMLAGILIPTVVIFRRRWMELRKINLRVSKKERREMLDYFSKHPYSFDPSDRPHATTSHDSSTGPKASSEN